MKFAIYKKNCLLLALSALGLGAAGGTTLVGCSGSTGVTPEAASAPGEPQETKTAPEGPVSDPVVSAEQDSAATGEGDSSEKTAVAATPSADATAPPPFPAGTKILHVGDSFAGALGKPLGVLLEEHAMKSVLKHTDSSYLTDWAWDGKLQEYIWKYSPDLVIVTLGANELAISEPELRRKTVSKLISTIGDVPCVWVAIPLWNGPQNGLMEVIRQSAAPCVYLDTNALMDTSKMPRVQDGIHPTTAAREAWAKDVLNWLQAHRKPEGAKPWEIVP